MIEQIIAFLQWIDQCDDLPPQCYDGTWMCTCQSFLQPLLIVGVVALGTFVLTIVRVFFTTIKDPPIDD